MDGAPVAGDVQPAADPDAIARRDIVQEALQRHDAARPAQQAAMHADAEHLGSRRLRRRARRSCPSGTGRRARRGNSPAAARSACRCSPACRARSAAARPRRRFCAPASRTAGRRRSSRCRIRSRHSRPPAGACGAVAAGIPAQRARTGQLFDGLHAQEHVFALGGLVHVLVVHPAPAVAGDLVAQLDAGRGQFGMALQGHAHAEHRQRQPPLLELAQDAPDASARAIFVDALHGRWRSG